MLYGSPTPRPRRPAIIAVEVPAGVLAHAALGESLMVKDGRARSEVAIREPPPRMAERAALELQDYIAKITGAKLPIVTKPSDGCSAQIYVGRSVHTDRLKVNAEDLAHGAFRMVSGPNWLALVGRDSSFVCGELLRMARSPRREERAKLLEEWHTRTGEKWGLPYSQFWKQYNADLKISEQDERGSFNAVCHFLRMLGVRWYMPNALGEIVPKSPTIALPRVNKTVRPDFAYRYAYQYGRLETVCVTN